jgi:hypothetical protein
VEALRVLIGGRQPEQSTVGIALVALRVVIMPCLSGAQRRTGVRAGLSQRGGRLDALAAVHRPVGRGSGLVINAALGWW